MFEAAFDSLCQRTTKLESFVGEAVPCKAKSVSDAGRHSKFANPATSVEHGFKRSVQFLVANHIDGEYSTVPQACRLHLRSDFHFSKVVGRMLIQYLAACTAPDANNAMVEQGTTAKTATVRNEQRNLDRPHAATDVAVAIEFFEPVESRIWSSGFAVTDVKPRAIRSRSLQDSDDCFERSRVVASAVNDSVIFHLECPVASVIFEAA